MSGMRDLLRKRLDWIPADARERTIDDVLFVLRSPTPMMVEEGAIHIRDAVGPVGLQAGKTSQATAEVVFSSMCLRASEGG